MHCCYYCQNSKVARSSQCCCSVIFAIVSLYHDVLSGWHGLVQLLAGEDPIISILEHIQLNHNYINSFVDTKNTTGIPHCQVRSLGMPFGGCKESGTGMEGTRWGISLLHSCSQSLEISELTFCAL